MPDEIQRKEAQLMKLVEPQFLSVVGLPANKTGFKVLRSAQGAKAITSLPRKRRQKRSDSSLLTIQFPAGITEAEASDMLITFGMENDYVLMSTEDEHFYLQRKEIDEDVEVASTPIELGGGYTANVATEAFAARGDSAITGVTLVGLEMDGFDTIEEVQGWLDGRSVNYMPDGIEVFDGGAVVTRHEVPEGQEVRKVRVAECVTGLVTRTEATDVPTKVYRSVIEQSYGQWGWGHLNFATALADPEFSERSWDAIYILRDILENIILYSGLPLDERKTLVQNATSDFNSYIVNLMDSLPRAVIEQARADRNAKQETPDMSKDTKEVKATRDDSAQAEDIEAKSTEENTEEVARTDAEATEATTEESTEAAPDYVTRDELKGVVAEAMREALGSKEEVQRTDEEEEAPANPVLDAIASLREDIDGKIDGLKSEIDELGGATVARSDNDDSDESQEDVQRDDADKSCFNGMFNGQLS